MVVWQVGHRLPAAAPLPGVDETARVSAVAMNSALQRGQRNSLPRRSSGKRTRAPQEQLTMVDMAIALASEASAAAQACFDHEAHDVPDDDEKERHAEHLGALGLALDHPDDAH